MVIHMMKTPCKPGRPARDQHLLGRMELFTTTFETMERNIREQLARIVGPGGFDPATRHHGHYGESLAPRLRLRVQLPLG